jgi:hypothetical protein
MIEKLSLRKPDIIAANFADVVEATGKHVKHRILEKIVKE